MDAGRLLSWQTLEVGVSGTFSHTQSGTPIDVGATVLGGLVSALSNYAPNDASWVNGIDCHVQFSYGVLSTTQTTVSWLVIPALGISESFGSAATTATSYVRFLNWKLYANPGGTWTARWTGIEWEANGVVRKTWGPGSLSSTYFTPAGVPLFGMPPYVSGSAFFTGTDAIDATFSYTADISYTGGWRFDAGAGMVALPVTPATLPAQPSVGPCTCLPTAASVSATNTFNCNGTAHADYSMEQGPTVNYVCPTICHHPTGDVPGVPGIYDVRVNTATYNIRGGGVTSLPDLSRSTTKIGDADYYAWWHRFGFPKTQKNAHTQCLYTPAAPGDPNFWNATTTVDVHPSRPATTNGVGEAAHAIEDPLADVCYAPIGRTSEKSVSTKNFITVIQHPACPPPPFEEPPYDLDGGPCYPPETNCFVAWDATFPSLVENGATNPGIAPYYDHSNPEARYANTIAAPHWNYLLWFPADLTELAPISPDEWRVSDIRRNPSDYWLPIRTQYGKKASFPGAEATLKRNSIVSEPLIAGQLASFVAANLLGQSSSFVGVSRFDLLDYTIPPTFAYDSGDAALFSGTDCALAFGGSITVDPDPGKFNVVVSLALASLTADPRMLPQVMEKIDVGWNVANVVACNVYLVGAYGEKVLLTSSSVAGALSRPLGVDTKYAGTWAQDKGNDEVSDTGLDELPSGDSEAVMLTDSRVQTFQMLGGRGASSLRFEIQVADPNVNVTLDYPVLSAPSSDAKVVAENGHHSAIVWADGPGVRFNQWSWWDGAELNTVPDVLDLGWPYDIGWLSSVLDALCYKRVVLEGRNRSDGLDAEIQSLYDSIENAGGSADARYARANTGTNAFVVEGADLAGHFLLVSSLREAPPAANLPVLDRNAQLAPLTTYADRSWSYCKGPRDVVYAGNDVLALIDPSDSTDWMTNSSVASGWRRARHDHEVDNNEGVSFLLKLGSSLIARISPWHGDFGVLGLGPTVTDVSYDVSLGFRHARATVRGGKVWIGMHEPSQIAGWQDFETAISAEKVEVRWWRTDRGQRLYLWTVLAGALDLRYSDDEGTTWSMADTIAASNVQDVGAEIGLNGLRYHYWIEGAGPYDAKGQIRDPQNTIIEAAFTAVAGVDRYGISAHEFVVEQGRHRFGLHVLVGGALKFYSSPDGKAFS